MNASPMGWRPRYANQFQRASKRRVGKVAQTKVVKAMLKRFGL